MKKEKEWSYGRSSAGSRVFDVCNVLFMLMLCFIMLYPMWYVLCASFSDPETLVLHTGPVFLPLNFSVVNYDKVLGYTPIWQGYRVTLFVVIVGTTLNLLFTSLLAYVLSRKNLMLRKLITGLCIFTMYFSGGMIPTFMIVKAVGLYNTIWALIIPGLISTYNMIVIRTAMQGVPDELIESASLDGANELTIFFRILMPMVKPTLAAIALFCAVGHWNSWTNALLYIRKSELQPLQMVVRALLIKEQDLDRDPAKRNALLEMMNQTMRYSVIIVSTVPVLCVYPFIQKYFTKGVMVGAVKG